uniref:Uncharacterized protein n=1 Tax=Arundo donax TaxID=35708 RepID=A0A0A8Z9A5_ARUDO
MEPSVLHRLTAAAGAQRRGRQGSVVRDDREEEHRHRTEKVKLMAASAWLEREEGGVATVRCSRR